MYRQQDRNRYGVRPARPRRQPKKHPSPGIPCRVKSPNGEYYDIDLEMGILEINPNNPDGHLFKSRSKATSRVWATIQQCLAEGEKWEGKRYLLENVT